VYIDLTLLAACLIGCLIGYQRGLIRCLISMLGSIVGIALFLYLQTSENSIRIYVAEITGNTSYYSLLLAVSLLIAWLCTSLIGSILSSLADQLFLGLPNRLLGAAVNATLFVAFGFIGLLVCKHTGILSSAAFEASTAFPMIEQLLVSVNNTASV
jgi:uncharacterized membrane protein required for colicin V production